MAPCSSRSLCGSCSNSLILCQEAACTAIAELSSHPTYYSTASLATMDTDKLAKYSFQTNIEHGDKGPKKVRQPTLSILACQLCQCHCIYTCSPEVLTFRNTHAQLKGGAGTQRCCTCRPCRHVGITRYACCCTHQLQCGPGLPSPSSCLQVPLAPGSGLGLPSLPLGCFKPRSR